MGENTFYVTTPIYYANAKPHLGHAYTTLVADSLTRFKRQRGIDTFFLTGTDEHGVNIERAVAEKGGPVKEYVDRMVEEYREAFARLGIEYDRWIRTTDDYHEAAVQNLWRGLFLDNTRPRYANDRSYGVGFECSAGADSMIFKNWWIA